MRYGRGNWEAERERERDAKSTCLSIEILFIAHIIPRACWAFFFKLAPRSLTVGNTRKSWRARLEL